MLTVRLRNPDREVELAGDRMVRDVLSELETAAYAFPRGIDYAVAECPLLAGDTPLHY